jgi:hypothetical protein
VVVVVLEDEELDEEEDSEVLLCAELEVVVVVSLAPLCCAGGVEPCVVLPADDWEPSPLVLAAAVAALSAPGASGEPRPTAVRPSPVASARSIARRKRRRAWAPVKGAPFTGASLSSTYFGPSWGPFCSCWLM